MWDVRASSDTPQIHEFTLKTGENPCYPPDVTEPEYRIAIPEHCRGFRIEPGSQCVLEVWGSGSTLFARQEDDPLSLT